MKIVLPFLVPETQLEQKLNFLHLITTPQWTYDSGCTCDEKLIFTTNCSNQYTV